MSKFALAAEEATKKAAAKRAEANALADKEGGLSKEEALQAITLDAAAILGIDDRCGSLEHGKDATLIVSAGDVLDMRTNAIRHAFIHGRMITLDDHHQQLDERKPCASL